MKTFNLTVLCQAYYTSSIEVPDDFTREQALEYARKHLDLCPIDSPLEYISDSDELDDENCDFWWGRNVINTSPCRLHQ